MYVLPKCQSHSLGNFLKITTVSKMATSADFIFPRSKMHIRISRPGFKKNRTGTKKLGKWPNTSSVRPEKLFISLLYKREVDGQWRLEAKNNIRFAHEKRERSNLWRYGAKTYKGEEVGGLLMDTGFCDGAFLCLRGVDQKAWPFLLLYQLGLHTLFERCPFFPRPSQMTSVFLCTPFFFPFRWMWRIMFCKRNSLYDN